jgi:hypothetical protein
MANLFFPLHISGIVDGSALRVDRALITLETPDGFSWTGNSDTSGPYSSQLNRAFMNVNLPVSVYTRLLLSPVIMRITLAVDQLQAGKQTSVPLSAQQFTVPDFGVCGSAPGWGGKALFSCRSAFRKPTLTLARIAKSGAPCSASQTELKFVGGDGWSGLINSEPAELGIGPMMFQWVGDEDDNGAMKNKHLCTGTPITFTQYEAVRHVQTTVTIPNVQLSTLR